MILDWPFYHHDLRRTGFTLLKGDLKESDTTQIGWKLNDSVNPGTFDFPSIADIDANGLQEILTATSITQGGSGTEFEGRFYVLECIKSSNKCRNFNEKWKFKRDNFTIGKSPSIDDLNNDGIKEVVFAGFGVFNAADDGTVYAFKANKKGKQEKSDASYTFDLPYEADQHGSPSDDYGEIGQTIIVDIDNQGNKEVLLADYTGVKNWRGHLYILEPGSNKQFTLQQNIQLGTSEASGGAKGAIAIANIDSDDYPEIIVPASFGIYYNFNKLSIINNFWRLI